MKKTNIFLSMEKEERWLNEMSEQGYNFIGRSWFNYEFEPAKEKGKYRYCIDIARIRNNAEIVESIEQLDFKLIFKHWMFYYYRAPRDGDFDGLYIDSKNKIFLYLRCIALLVFVGCMNILIMRRAKGPYFLNMSFPFVFNLTVLCIIIYIIIKYIRNIIFLIREK